VYPCVLYAHEADALVSLQFITGYVCQAVRCSDLNSRFLIWYQLRLKQIPGDTKKRELLKTPTKIEEIQEKKIIDRN